MQPIVTFLPASLPTTNPLEPDSTPFESSPQSPTSATTSSSLSSSHRANRPAGQHNVRGVQAVEAEAKLYRWRDGANTGQQGQEQGLGQEEEAGGSDGRVRAVGVGVGVGSTLWQRRQEQANRRQSPTTAG